MSNNPFKNMVEQWRQEDPSYDELCKVMNDHPVVIECDLQNYLNDAYEATKDDPENQSVANEVTAYRLGEQ